MNKVILIGRTVSDIELFTLQNGAFITNFNLAVTRDFKNQDGSISSDFISCVASGKLAETLSKYVKKGNRISLEGRINTRNYTDNNGVKHYITEVKVSKIEFLESKKQEEKTIGEKVVESVVDNMVKQNEPITESDPFVEFGEEVVISDDDLPF